MGGGGGQAEPGNTGPDPLGLEQLGDMSPDEMADTPQFQQLRAMIRQHPEMLGQVLAMLQDSNPQLMQHINEHQEEFLAMLQEPDGDEEGDDEEGDEVDDFLAAMQEGGGGMPPGMPGVVQLSPEEMA